MTDYACSSELSEIEVNTSAYDAGVEDTAETYISLEDLYTIQQKMSCLFVIRPTPVKP